MNLIDAGPLVALNHPGDPLHRSCLAEIDNDPFAVYCTSWACFAEAMHLLGRSGGFRRQAALWHMRSSGLVTLADLSADEIQLAEFLMSRFQDHPMDLGDATLVALADCRGWRKVFTLDTHFFAYRLRNGDPLDVTLPTKE